MRTSKAFRILSLVLFLLALSSTTFAARPEISSDKQTFDFLSGRYLLDGNVCVKWPDRTITAEHAQVSLLTMEVWAQGNITLRQDDIFFRGDDLHVTGNSHTADINGNTRFERGDLTIQSNVASFNWDTKLAEFSENVVRILAGEKKEFSRLVYNVITKEFAEEKE
ncbi:MAG: organic solvent tolerance protein OstA [Schwartzia sp.]|nr:organic solvent tolerance protein OstA [Schwartzia sp. (in: firmicutes)]